MTDQMTDQMTDAVLYITDAVGRILPPFHTGEGEGSEPLPGSVVLTEGEFGTAWQRHFSDGLWHSCSGRAPATWTRLLRKRNLVLVYDAEPR